MLPDRTKDRPTCALAPLSRGLTWDKQIRGMGDYLRNVTEHCILGVRGKPLVELTRQTTLISERRRQHSRKPEAFYRLVESLCPGSKLEMFARQRRSGWQSVGVEAEMFSNDSTGLQDSPTGLDFESTSNPSLGSMEEQEPT